MFTWTNFAKGSIVSMRYSGQQHFEVPDVDVYADEFKSMDNLLIGIDLGQRKVWYIANIKQMITIRKSPAHIVKVLYLLIVIWDHD